VGCCWSYEPFERGIVGVDASYDTGLDREILAATPVDPILTPRLDGSLAAPGEVRRPTGYLVTFDSEEVGAVTDLRLGFPAAIDGVPGQLDLAGGFVFLAFAEQLASIVAPMPVDTDDADPASLFVSVDLAQRLASGMPVNRSTPDHRSRSRTARATRCRDTRSRRRKCGREYRRAAWAPHARRGCAVPPGRGLPSREQREVSTVRYALHATDFSRASS
jgi:hypothetical protein